MCEFCESLLDKSKEISWQVRSRMADDNLYEFMEELNDYNFVDEQCDFSISGHEYEGNVYVGIDYNHTLEGKKIGEVIVYPFSETVQFNFCPFCGKQISKDIKLLEDGNGYGIVIYDK